MKQLRNRQEKTAGFVCGENMSNLELTKKELATVAGYTYRRLHDIDMSLPEDGKLFVKGEGGKCDLADFVQRWVKYNLDKGTEDEKSLEEAKTLHEMVKTRKTELEVARLEGRLVDVTDVKKLWADIANAVMQNLIRLPSKIAPQVTMMGSVEKIRTIIDEEIRAVLANIADTPLPVYAADGESEEEAEEDE